MMMPRRDYVDALLHRARVTLETTDWLFVALEANRNIARDNVPRPIPAQESPHYIEFAPSEKDCVTIASLRKHLFLSGRQVPNRVAA